MQYEQVQVFRQEPDMYDGDNCNLHRPRWMTSYPKHGDDEDGEILEFKLHARLMPPGSRVTIQVPVCPECGDPANMTEPKRKQRKWPNCRCGFSWAKWASEEYS